jgi:outer membrane protein TolC
MRILALLAAATLMTAARAEDKPAKERTEESTKKIKELQKERIATLKELADATMKLAQGGRAELSDALEARMTLLKAELEVAEKESDRIALLKKALESLEEYLQVAKARHDAGRGTVVPGLKIKAQYQEIQIQLEQAKMKEAKSK